MAISIHTLHEESDERQQPDVLRRPISIHALHEESDRDDMVFLTIHEVISIHALHEESDLFALYAIRPYYISIHALHEESDLPVRPLPPTTGHFNPRSP